MENLKTISNNKLHFLLRKRSPNTIGYKTKKEAVNAWYHYETTAICDRITQPINEV